MGVGREGGMWENGGEGRGGGLGWKCRGGEGRDGMRMEEGGRGGEGRV